MRAVWRPSVVGVLVSAGGLCTLLLGMGLLDHRVHDGVRYVFARGDPSGELMSATVRAQELLTFIVQAVRYQSMEHAPLVLFSLGASVLVLFMLRS